MVNVEDREILYSITRTQLETQLLNLKSSLEVTYQIAKKEADEAKTTQDRLLACETKDSARLDIVRSLVDGSEYIKKVDEYFGEKDKSKQKLFVKHRE